jgi:RIO kinase 2
MDAEHEGETEGQGDEEEEEEEYGSDDDDELEIEPKSEEPVQGTGDHQKSEQNIMVDEFSDPPSLDERQVSRSPPKSRSPSPSALEKMTASLSLSGSQQPEIRDVISSDLRKQRARQERKHHSKRGARSGGRPHGSKAKQDVRCKLDKSGVWD